MSSTRAYGGEATAESETGEPRAGAAARLRAVTRMRPAADAPRYVWFLILAQLACIILPWVSFTIQGTSGPQQGAGSLFGVATGLTVMARAGAPAPSSPAVILVLALLVAGAALSAVNRLGGTVTLAASLVYFLAVHSMLVAAGAAVDPPVAVGLAPGFWIALLCALASMAPALAEVVGLAKKPPEELPQEAEQAPPPVVASEGAPRPLLSVRNLTVRFFTYDGVLKALDGVTFDVYEREILGIVGETGCGKSVTAKAILRIIPDPPGRITGGAVLLDGINLLDSIESEARIKVNARGRARIRRNRRIAGRVEAVMRIIRGNDISMIFQEPSAALNPVMTVGEQVSEAFLTHQIGGIVDRLDARHPPGRLVAHFHDLLRRREARDQEVHEMYRRFSVRNAELKAAQAAGDPPLEASLRAEVDAADKRIRQLTGVYRVRFTIPVVTGLVTFVSRATYGVFKWCVSLDTRINLWRSIPVIGKAWLMGPIKAEVTRRAVEMLKQVNIPDPARKADAYPFELSGGMQQRVMIAMALACRPRLLLADEPTTALDVTIQAQILSLIRNLRDQFGSSVILITHDLGVVAETCERVGVMYAGVMAEIGRSGDIFNAPKHPYTVGLLRSIPETYARTGKLSIIPGSVPSLLNPPAGCRFHPRCPFASEKCKSEVPALFQVSPDHQVACHLYDHPEYFGPAAIAARDAGLTRAWEQAVVQ